MKKSERLVRETWNLACRNLRSCLEKRLENGNFLLAAVHCEFDIWNKYKYFTNIFITWISKDIWIRFSRAMFNWSPQFYSHLFCSLCELQLILWQFLLLQKTVFNSYPDMNWKWNCKGGNIQIFLSEIFLAEENGSQGHNFGKILNSTFLKGLLHSALQKEHSASFLSGCLFFLDNS